MKKIIILTAIGLSACTQEHTYRVAINFIGGAKDTLTINVSEDWQIYLGTKGCLETPTRVEACGIQTIRILTKDGASFRK